MAPFRIGERLLGPDQPTYFIADIAANHDGDFDRAVRLIRLAREAGADAAKFQHFQAPRIVSRYGFEHLGGQFSHQKSWNKPVCEVYAEASIPYDWSARLKAACDEIGIDFFSTPYDFEAVDLLAPLVPAFKIGSGDITWGEMLEHVARQGKPVLLATGASDMAEVGRAVAGITAVNPQLALMQCNTNYTGSTENFRHVHLNVLRTFAERFPGLLLGLSDHTPGHAAVLGAVALGARVVEKHFTDDNSRPGPDHGFSLDPRAWRDMVQRTRELEQALGHGLKRVEANEAETVVVQRRCVRAARAVRKGERLGRADLDVLRPAPKEAIDPWDIGRVLGKCAARDLEPGEHLDWNALADCGD